MNNETSRSVLVGLLAGAASAFLLTGAASPSYVSFILLASGALPILIAGLSWSNVASITAVVAASSLIAVLSGPLSALSLFMTSLGPAAWIAHLASLARPAEELGGPKDALAWYPLADILLHICALVAVSVVVLGYLVGYGPELTSQLVDQIVAAMGEANPDVTMTPDIVANLKVVMLKALPAIQGGVWVTILFAMYYIAAGIVRVSGRARRPKDDIPAQLRMPKLGVPAFALGIAMTFLPGALGLVGWVLVGTFGAGFTLAGFAMVHHGTRGKPWRLPVLWFSYFLVIAFSLPLIIFLAFGLSATARTVTVSRGNPKP